MYYWRLITLKIIVKIIAKRMHAENDLPFEIYCGSEISINLNYFKRAFKYKFSLQPLVKSTYTKYW